MNTEALYKLFLESQGVSTDTRHELRHKIFFALKGENFDANDFVEKAVELGCSLAVCERSDLEGHKGVLVVPSALAALQQLARHHRRSLGIPVLGITGSNGKTTTKELLAAVLSKKFRVAFTRGNFNNHIGVPLTLLDIRDADLAVIEMGANHAGEIALLASIAEPDLGIITNVGRAHLEGFGSLEGVLQAKGELYDFLATTGGKALVDAGEQRLIQRAAESGVETLLVGHHLQVEPALQLQPTLKAGAVLQAEPCLRAENPFLKIDLELNGSYHSCQTGLVGTYNLQNIRMAAAAGLYWRVEPSEIAKAIAEYRPSNQRSQLMDSGRNTLALDSYNANPSSMKVAIEAFITYAGSPRMLILGDMAELGDASEQEHLDLAKWLSDMLSANTNPDADADAKANKAPLDEVCLAGPNFYALKGSLPGLKIFPDRAALEAHLEKMKPEGWHILLKGSRVMQLEKLGPVLWEA